MNVVPMHPPVAPLTDEDINFESSCRDETPRFPASWCLLDDVELLDLPDPEFLIEGIFPRRGVGVLYSPASSGKTTLAASIAVSVATGREWFGHPVKHPGAVIYVGAEDPGGFKIRLRAAKRAAQLPLTKPIGVFTFPEAIKLCDPVSVAQFRAFLQHQAQGTPLELVMVDTYAASTIGANETSAEDTGLAMAHAQQWRDLLNVTVLLIHHTNAGGSRERGHSAMRGAADFMMAMNPDSDTVHVEVNKQRNGAQTSLTLKLVPAPDGQGCVFRLAKDVMTSKALSPTQAKVYAVHRQTFGAAGATKTEWRSSCGDVPERTFYHAVTKLEEAGYVSLVGSHYRRTNQEPACA